MLGYYGETIGPRDPAVIEAAAKHAKKEPITCRPADLLKPEWETLRSQAIALKGCNGTDEDVLTYAMFPQVAPKFFAQRANGPINVSKAAKPAEPASAGGVAAPKAGNGAPSGKPTSYKVTLGNTSHQVTVESV
jgi:methylmalonyl-CoA carboxyltransferase 5S subunit